MLFGVGLGVSRDRVTGRLWVAGGRNGGAVWADGAGVRGTSRSSAFGCRLGIVYAGVPWSLAGWSVCRRRRWPVGALGDWLMRW